MGYYYLTDGSMLVNGGYLYNLTDFPIDLSLPFYDECSYETFLINNRLYHLYSNITFSHYEAASVLYYNKQLLEDRNIKNDPYSLWKEGKWTLDTMLAMTEKAAVDKDNNGKFTLNRDIVGFSGLTYRHIPVVMASGEDTVKWNEEEKTFDLNIASENMISIGQQINKFLTSPWNDDSNTGKTAQTAFARNMVLFYSNSLGSFREMRSNDDPYAIILWPGVEENTEILAHLRNPAPVGVASDLDKEEAEKVGTLMTALSAYCYDYILEEYVSLAVVARSSRDENSADVVRYVLDHRAYDTSECHQLGAHHWWNGVVETGEYASTAKSKKGEFINYCVAPALVPYFPEEAAE